MSSLVQAVNVGLEFDGGNVLALNGLSLDIEEGTFVALTGPSGCGKSSLLSIIGSLEKPSSGELLYRSRPYGMLGDLAAFRRKHIGFIFQSFHLIPTLTAVQNVVVATFGSAGSPKDCLHHAGELLDSLGLRDRRNHLPAQLSGGERQRVAIARALINEPELILADEPTGSLDSKAAGEVLDLISMIREKRGITVIMVTHDASAASRADRIVQLRDGRVESEGMKEHA